jgi:hypothetical protein
MEPIDRFDIRGLLGEGGYSKRLTNIGKVLKAYDRLSKQEIALKIEKNTKCKIVLKHEYEILKQLQSNNLTNFSFFVRS